MSSPVNLSDLPTASSAADGDLMLLRKGLTDFKINVSLIRNIDLSVLDTLMSPVASDLFYVQRTNQSYSVNFAKIGFAQSTKMWFYQGIAPAGWSIVAGTGDKLLGVSDGTNQYSATSGGSQGGTWQQVGVTLSIDQIPNHTHSLPGSSDNTSSTSTNYARYGKTDHAGPDFIVQGVRNSTNPIGTSLPHNHGNTWRPLANVGIICNKDL